VNILTRKIRDKINHLRSLGFSGFRSVRGDGNCFYRAIAVGLVENCFNDKEQLEKLRKQISEIELPQDVREELKKFIGFTEKTDHMEEEKIQQNNTSEVNVPQICEWQLQSLKSLLKPIEPLLDISEAEAQALLSKQFTDKTQELFPFSIYQIQQYTELFKKCGINVKIEKLGEFTKSEAPQVVCQICDVAGHTAKNCTEIIKKTWFKNQSLLQSLVRFLRNATIHEIKNNEIFKFYLGESETLEDRCTRISTMGEEAEHFEINALLTFLGVGTTLFQIDREDAKTTIQTYTLPNENSIPKLFLLYRPGHYDLLYKHF